jgi:hypothetical protein
VAKSWLTASAALVLASSGLSAQSAATDQAARGAPPHPPTPSPIFHPVSIPFVSNENTEYVFLPNEVSLLTSFLQTLPAGDLTGIAAVQSEPYQNDGVFYSLGPGGVIWLYLSAQSERLTDVFYPLLADHLAEAIGENAYNQALTTPQQQEWMTLTSSALPDVTPPPNPQKEFGELYCLWALKSYGLIQNALTSPPSSANPSLAQAIFIASLFLGPPSPSPVGGHSPFLGTPVASLEGFTYIAANTQNDLIPPAAISLDVQKRTFAGAGFDSILAIGSYTFHVENNVLMSWSSGLGAFTPLNPPVALPATWLNRTAAVSSNVTSPFPSRVEQTTAVSQAGRQPESIILSDLQSLPARRQTLGATISAGLPPAGRASSAHPEASSSSSPISASNFSYLSFLIGTLPFVQKIGIAVEQAGFLGGAPGLAILEGLQGSPGPSQEGFGYALAWMFDDAFQGNLPQVMTYQTSLGNAIPVDNTFEPTATGQVFSPADLASLTQFLDILPPSLLQNIQAIVNGPVIAMTGGTFGSYTFGIAGGDVIAIDSGDEINIPNLPHEIGITVYGSDLFQQRPLGQQWDALWSQSTDPVWDTADFFSNFPPRPTPANQPIPFGDTNEVEDFASVFNDWVNESAAPAINLSLNPPQSTSIVEQGAYAATQGHTILLQKVLLMAALFTDQATQQLSLYNYQGYKAGNTIERSLSQVQSSPTSLTLGNYTFTIQNPLLAGVSTPATQATLASGAVQKIPALNYTFPTPVPIPAFAANIWGIQ